MWDSIVCDFDFGPFVVGIEFVESLEFGHEVSDLTIGAYKKCFSEGNQKIPLNKSNKGPE